MMRTYAQAIDCLNGLQSNAATIEATRRSGGKGGDIQLAEQVEYMRRVGYEVSRTLAVLRAAARSVLTLLSSSSLRTDEDTQPADLDRMNVLHITGTKGKGSTSAFVSSVLTTIAPDARVGLYTSPHMVAVRERIRINGEPISEDLFARYFFEVWDKLEQNRPVRLPCLSRILLPRR